VKKENVNTLYSCWMDGRIKKGGTTSGRSRTPACGPLFGPNVLPKVKKEKRNKTEENRIKKKQKRY
jgi:hypothetical protein